MHVGLLGRKVGMTQIYQENRLSYRSRSWNVARARYSRCTADKDGYHAWQLGFADKKRKKATQAERVVMPRKLEVSRSQLCP